MRTLDTEGLAIWGESWDDVPAFCANSSAFPLLLKQWNSAMVILPLSRWEYFVINDL